MSMLKNTSLKCHRCRRLIHGVIAVGKNLLEATKLLIDSTDKEKPYIFTPWQKKSNT